MSTSDKNQKRQREWDSSDKNKNENAPADEDIVTVPNSSSDANIIDLDQITLNEDITCTTTATDEDSNYATISDDDDDELHVLSFAPSPQEDLYKSRYAAEITRLREEDNLIMVVVDPSKKLQMHRDRYACGPLGFRMIRSNRNNALINLQDDVSNAKMHKDILKKTGGYITNWATTIKALKVKSEERVVDENAVETLPLMRRGSNVHIDENFDCPRRYEVDATLNKLLYLYQGDVTALEVDCIVNAAKNSLMGGGGIDGAIHGAAGPLLKEECKVVRSTTGNCPTGQTRLTRGYSLPAKFVLHTVGPIGGGDEELRSCYFTCLETIREHNLKVFKQRMETKQKTRAWNGVGPAVPNLDGVSQTKVERKTISELQQNGEFADEIIRSVAFCCVSTGIFGFPLVRAAHIALRCVREWMEIHKMPIGPLLLGGLESVVFTVFTDNEKNVYERLMPSYFPVKGYPSSKASA